MVLLWEENGEKTFIVYYDRVHWYTFVVPNLSLSAHCCAGYGWFWVDDVVLHLQGAHPVCPFRSRAVRQDLLHAGSTGASTDPIHLSSSCRKSNVVKEIKDSGLMIWAKHRAARKLSGRNNHVVRRDGFTSRCAVIMNTCWHLKSTLSQFIFITLHCSFLYH